MKQALLIIPPGALIAGPVGPAGADGAAGAAGADAGVFKLNTGTVLFSCEVSALVGKCLVYVPGSGWTGTHPASSTPSHYALAVGLTDGILTCVFLGSSMEAGRVVTVPSAMVTGGSAIENVVFIDSTGDYCAVLGNGTNLYYGETWTVLAVADGVTLLKKCYSAM